MSCAALGWVWPMYRRPGACRADCLWSIRTDRLPALLRADSSVPSRSDLKDAQNMRVLVAVKHKSSDLPPNFPNRVRLGRGVLDATSERPPLHQDFKPIVLIIWMQHPPHFGHDF